MQDRLLACLIDLVRYAQVSVATVHCRSVQIARTIQHRCRVWISAIVGPRSERIENRLRASLIHSKQHTTIVGTAPSGSTIQVAVFPQYNSPEGVPTVVSPCKGVQDSLFV